MAMDAASPPDRNLDPPDPLLAWQGRVLGGRYRLGDVLGTGGVGVVYRADDLQRNAPAAVKVLGDCGAFQTMSRFEREGQTLSRLAHPHIVETLGYGVSEGVPYLAMELLEGITLAQSLEDGEPLPLEQVFEIGRQVLEGLAYAHRMGVVHRDLKPANVFLELASEGCVRVKLLDFGLAKLLSPDTAGMASTLTQTGMVMGTPLYMAPEQATGGRVDFTADVYAAGAVLFEMLTGQPPFLAETHHGLIKAHLLEPVPLVSALRRDLHNSEAIDALIGRAMAKEPRARFQDGQSMLEALSALMVRPGRSTTGRSSKARLLRVCGVLAGVLLLSLPGYWLLSGVVDGWDTNEGSAPGQQADRRDLPPPRDIWQALGVPEPLSAYYEKVAAGGGINREELRVIQEYARQNRGDPRPYLLLGRGFTNRQWRKDAVQRYLWAFRADASARGDPHMLQDLLSIAAHDVFGPSACEAIAEIYGREALAEVRRAAERAPRGTAHAERLGQLAQRMAGP